MFEYKALIIFLVSASICLAQSIHISGVVKDGTTLANLKDVEVRLLHLGLADTTDNTGLFSIESNQTNSIKADMGIKNFAPPVLAGRGSVTFALLERERVSIQTYSVQGKLLFSMQDELQSGAHTMSLPAFSKGIFLYRITLGDKVYTFKDISTADNKGTCLSMGRSSLPSIGTFASGFAKKNANAVFNDTLLVQRIGYLSKKIPIASPVIDTTILLTKTDSLDYWKGVYQGTYGLSDTAMYGTWHVVIDSAGIISGEGDGGQFTITGTVDKNGNLSMGATWRGNVKTASFSGAIGLDCTVNGTFTESGGISGIFKGKRISSVLITITGTVTLPAPQPGKTFIINIDNDFDGGNGTLASISGTLGSGTSFNYRMAYMPGSYYQICLVDLDGDMQPSHGDYLGGYAITSIEDVPTQPNLSLKMGGQSVFDFGLFTWSATGVLLNGDFSKGMAYWTIKTEDGAVAVGNAGNGEMHVKIDTIGPYDWDIRINYWGGLQITLDKTYELSFEAWSDGNKKIRPDINGFVGNTFTHYLSFAAVDLTTQKKKFTMTGIMHSPTTDNAWLDFFLSDNSQGVYLDNISLTELP